MVYMSSACSAYSTSRMQTNVSLGRNCLFCSRVTSATAQQHNRNHQSVISTPVGQREAAVNYTNIQTINDDDDDSKSYVRPLLQLETVTSVLVIRSDKQFSFQITTELGCKMAAAQRCWKRIPGTWSCHGKAVRTVLVRPCGWNHLMLRNIEENTDRCQRTLQSLVNKYQARN